MLLNIIMFIIGAACGFAFAVWAETEDEDDEYLEEDCSYDEKDEYIEEDCSYYENEKI